MSDNVYVAGNLVRVTGNLTVNATGTALDPNTITVTYRRLADEAATTLTYGVDNELVRSAEGIYYTDIDADAAGLWVYRFASTGDGQAAQEGSFTVTRESGDMTYIRELWLWLGEHQTAAIVVMVLVAALIALSMVINYDLIGAFMRLRELVQ